MAGDKNNQFWTQEAMKHQGALLKALIAKQSKPIPISALKRATKPHRPICYKSRQHT